VVHLADVAEPVPKDNEVLVRVRATTVTTGDWRARSLSMPPGFGAMGRLVFGLLGPRQPILGNEMSGIIEAVGRSVTLYSPGDEVFAFTDTGFGCHAEYRTIAEDGLIAPKPGNLSFEEAAALSFGGTTALAFLRDKAGIQAGDKVLIVGASGCVGTAAVQIARALGAEVTGVASTGNMDLVRSIGAQYVIDYTKEDFSRSDKAWDIILDTTGTAPFERSSRVLRPGGRLLVVLGSLGALLGIGRPPKRSNKRVLGGVATPTPEHIRTLAELAHRGALKPVIDRSYPLEHAAEAHAYVDAGRKRGSVVLAVAS
jgi:NADPH:quinone reductase-like Zn-dependent oxidoreductase